MSGPFRLAISCSSVPGSITAFNHPCRLAILCSSWLWPCLCFFSGPWSLHLPAHIGFAAAVATANIAIFVIIAAAGNAADHILTACTSQ